jgi:hypothetical protein
VDCATVRDLAKAKAPRPTGRPSTYTEEAAQAIIAELDFGMSWPDSCALAGIPESTARLWTTEHEDFLRGIKSARANAHRRALARIQEAGDRWQSAAWFLERHDFQNWGARQAVEMSGPNGGPISTEAITPVEAVLRQRQLLGVAGLGSIDYQVDPHAAAVSVAGNGNGKPKNGNGHGA